MAKVRARRNYAYCASHDPTMLREAGLLATSLTDYTQRGEFCFRMSDFAVAAYDLEMAKCAAGLIGTVHIGHGIWSTAPNENAPHVSFPPTLLRDYLEEWACHLPYDEEPSG